MLITFGVAIVQKVALGPPIANVNENLVINCKEKRHVDKYKQKVLYNQKS